MYVIIVGAGQIGRHLANILAEEDADVVVIEKSEEACKNVKDLNEAVGRIALGDIDRDGRTDVVAIGASTHNLKLYENLGR